MTEGEKITNIINKTFFFKEFSFPRNLFTPKNESQLEFADLVIAIATKLVVFQHKGRNNDSIKGHDEELKWFNNTVKKEAKNQIKTTISYLSKYKTIPVTNNRNHKIDLNINKFNDIYKIIIYDSDFKYDISITNQKFYNSEVVGLIHLLSKDQYELICKILQTPIEILEYLKFREQMFCKDPEKTKVSEKKLIGIFLSPNYQLLNNNFTSICDKHYSLFKKERMLYDLKFLINNFYNRIIGEKQNNYYSIVQELALLNSKQIKEFNLRLSIAKEKSKFNKKYKPNWFSLPFSNCSFVFIAAPIESKLVDAITDLKFYTNLLKYDTKVDKCIGLIVIQEQDNFHYQIHWTYLNGKWSHNPIIEEYLDNHFPFGTSTVIMKT